MHVPGTKNVCYYNHSYEAIHVMPPTVLVTALNNEK